MAVPHVNRFTREWLLSRMQRQTPPCGVCGRLREPVPGTRDSIWFCPVCGVEGEREEALMELERRAGFKQHR